LVLGAISLSRVESCCLISATAFSSELSAAWRARAAALDGGMAAETVLAAVAVAGVFVVRDADAFGPTAGPRLLLVAVGGELAAVEDRGEWPTGLGMADLPVLAREAGGRVAGRESLALAEAAAAGVDDGFLREFTAGGKLDGLRATRDVSAGLVEAWPLAMDPAGAGSVFAAVALDLASDRRRVWRAEAEEEEEVERAEEDEGEEEGEEEEEFRRAAREVTGAGGRAGAPFPLAAAGGEDLLVVSITPFFGCLLGAV